MNNKFNVPSHISAAVTVESHWQPPEKGGTLKCKGKKWHFVCWSWRQQTGITAGIRGIVIFKEVAVFSAWQLSFKPVCKLTCTCMLNLSCTLKESSVGELCEVGVGVEQHWNILNHTRSLLISIKVIKLFLFCLVSFSFFGVVMLSLKVGSWSIIEVPLFLHGRERRVWQAQVSNAQSTALNDKSCHLIVETVMVLAGACYHIFLWVCILHRV